MGFDEPRIRGSGGTTDFARGLLTDLATEVCRTDTGFIGEGVQNMNEENEDRQ